MRLYRDLKKGLPDGGRGRSVAIGVFDGVHRGHREILERAVRAARAGEGNALVLTFDPHPDSVVGDRLQPPALTSLRQKIDLVEALGVDEMAVIPFDEEVAALTPRAFCGDLLADRLGARFVTVGENFRFGAGGAGRVNDLRAWGEELGYQVESVPLLSDDGGVVSSTRIREALGRGDVESASRLLGRDYSLEGHVVAGAGRGRDLGVPTANLQVPGDMALPAPGVYVTSAWVSGKIHPAVTSIGTNPTFEDDAVLRVETHLLDFRGGLYGLWMRIDFLRRLRGQRRFDGAGELIEQMWADIAAASAHFAQGPPTGGGHR